jgi:hypothetical protein
MFFFQPFYNIEQEFYFEKAFGICWVSIQLELNTNNDDLHRWKNREAEMHFRIVFWVPFRSPTLTWEEVWFDEERRWFCSRHLVIGIDVRLTNVFHIETC